MMGEGEWEKKNTTIPSNGITFMEYIVPKIRSSNLEKKNLAEINENNRWKRNNRSYPKNSKRYRVGSHLSRKWYSVVLLKLKVHWLLKRVQFFSRQFPLPHYVLSGPRLAQRRLRLLFYPASPICVIAICSEVLRSSVLVSWIKVWAPDRVLDKYRVALLT